MKANLTQARTRESAVAWLAGFDPGDVYTGPVGRESAENRDSLFYQPVVLAAFAAGAEWAADQAGGEFTVEWSTGQHQLEAAGDLMDEAAAVFRSYAEHHQARADAATEPEAERASLEKAKRNLLMAARLEAWLVGEEVFPTSLPATPKVEIEDGGVERHFDATGTVGRSRPGWWDRALGQINFPGVTAMDHARRIADRMGEGLNNKRNIRLYDPPVASSPAFPLRTGDPRFDPSKPVTVNGFTYHPATED